MRINQQEEQDETDNRNRLSGFFYASGKALLLCG